VPGVGAFAFGADALLLRDIEPVSLGSLTEQQSGESLMAVTGAEPGGPCWRRVPIQAA
jgi:hypothetical protein